MSDPLLFYFQEHDLAVNGSTFPAVCVTVHGLPWGDPLTDNAYQQDFYRYHDVFHLGLEALAGASPVTHYFLHQIGLRNQPGPYGPAARQVEECLSLTSFVATQTADPFQHQPASKLWLRQMAEMTTMADLPIAGYQWPSLLVNIYDVFGNLARNRGGIVAMDCDYHMLTYVL